MYKTRLAAVITEKRNKENSTTLEVVEMNYKINPFGKSLRSNQSFLIGVIIPTIIHEVIPTLLQGIANELFKNGYGQLCYTYTDADDLREKAAFMLHKRVDGVIVFPARPDEEKIYKIYAELARNVPFVATSGYKQDIYPRVLVDGYIIGKMGTEYLISKGHRRIALINEIVDWRTDGYREVLENNGIAFSTDYIFSDFSKPFTGEQIIDWLMAFPPEKRPTAVFTLSDKQAVQIIKAAHKKGLILPQDLSVIATDDTPIAELASPALTTVSQPHYEQGVQGARLLLKLIAGEKAYNLMLTPTLIERESVRVCSVD